MTNTVQALTRYVFKQAHGREILQASPDGKHDVTADFDALVLEHLLDPDAPRICEQLDGAAKGMDLDESERAEIAAFRVRLVELIERHNTTGHGASREMERAA